MSERNTRVFESNFSVVTESRQTYFTKEMRTIKEQEINKKEKKKNDDYKLSEKHDWVLWG